MRMDTVLSATLRQLEGDWARLVEAARPHLDVVSTALALDHAIFVTDRDGVVLHCRSNQPAFLRSAGLAPGSELAESVAGTSAIALALASSTGAVVVGPEHTLDAWQAYTSIAAPIPGAGREPAGAVGILTPNVPGVEGRLALVSLAAHVVGRELAAAEDVTERKGAEARLLREQELLERIIGTIPVMITLYQPSTRVLRVNAEFERVTGWTNEDVARADLMELCYPDPEYRAEVAEYMRSLQAGWRDIQLTTRHAGVIETAWANIRISDDTQVGIGLDLRERQRAARALRESEERFLSAERALRESEEGFRILANSIPQLAWMADAEGWIFWYNDRWYEYTGRTLEESVGWRWTAVHHPDHVDRVVERLRHAWQTGEAWEDTFPLRSRTGEYRWFLSRALPIRDDEGRIIRWFGTNTDVTDQLEEGEERERRVRHLERERERLREVLDEAPAGIMISIGPQHIVESANQAYRRHVGGREILGRPLGRALPEIQDQPFLTLMDGVFRTGEAAVGREMLARLHTGPDGQPEARYFDYAYQPLRDRDGRVYGILAHTVDATDRVRAREDVEKASQAKSDFIATISHELRTPLTGVLGYAELLRTGVPEPIPDGAVRHVDRILLAARHLQQIIDQILTFSRLEAGGEQVRLAEVPVPVLADEVRGLVQPMADHKGLALAVDYRAAPATITTDQGKLRQILLNLLGNAVKYTDAGRVDLVVQEAGAAVLFQVRDTGVGIAADALERVFEPFWQAEAPAATMTSGTGLGLSITRELVRILGGEIRVESEAGCGSTFTVRLPVSC
jgi:PAS domain S-box-containing protein